MRYAREDKPSAECAAGKLAERATSCVSTTGKRKIITSDDAADEVAKDDATRDDAAKSV